MDLLLEIQENALIIAGILHILTLLDLPWIMYESTVWDPYLQKDVAERKEFRKRYSLYQAPLPFQRPWIHAMLKELGLPSLESRRKENRLCQLFKISKGLIRAIPSSDHLTLLRNNIASFGVFSQLNDEHIEKSQGNVRSCPESRGKLR